MGIKGIRAIRVNGKGEGGVKKYLPVNHTARLFLAIMGKVPSSVCKKISVVKLINWE
jgi:hypothetical protein